jgi:hypothetical protein
MARDEDAGHFEWVNAWASTAPAQTSHARAAAQPAPVAAAPAAPRYTVTRALEATTIVPEVEGEGAAPHRAEAPAAPTDQLMRDIAEIERTRDALAGGALGQRMRAFMLVPSRTADATPLVIGGILALAMLTVFGAAAAVSKFSAR